MKAWRRDAAAVKQHAIATGKHERGARYGRALRNARRARGLETGLVTPLMAALFLRHTKVYYGHLETAFREALAQLDREQQVS